MTFKKCIFGVFFEDDSRSFKFSIGDRLQIKELASYVQKIVDDPEPNANIQHFAPFTEKNNKKSIVQQGTHNFFGFNRKAITSNELDTQIEHKVMEPLATDLKQELRQKLFQNLVKMLEKREIVQKKIEKLCCDQIVVSIVNDEQISGKFPCVLCNGSSRKFVAQCTQKKGQYYWTLSNYARHVQKRHEENENVFDNDPDSAISVDDLSSHSDGIKTNMNSEEIVEYEVVSVTMKMICLMIIRTIQLI